MGTDLRSVVRFAFVLRVIWLVCLRVDVLGLFGGFGV